MKCQPVHMVSIHHPRDRNRIVRERKSMDAEEKDNARYFCYSLEVIWLTMSIRHSNLTILKRAIIVYISPMDEYVSIQNVILTRTGVGLILKSCSHELGKKAFRYFITQATKQLVY